MTSVREYYEGEVQRHFDEAIASASADVLNQPEFTATYEVSGDDAGTYGLRIAGGQLEVIPGGILNSDMHIVAEHEEWHQGAEVGMANPFYYYARRKVALIKSFRGAVILDLAQDDGDSLEGKIIFGGTEVPSVTVRMQATDYLAMMGGKLNGQMAFMTGKLKFDGSLPLLMQLGALNS